MKLIEGVHAMDGQVIALQRLAHELGISAIGERTHCAPYGCRRWCELTWQDAGALEQSLRAVAAQERAAGGKPPPSRFWVGPV